MHCHHSAFTHITVFHQQQVVTRNVLKLSISLIVVLNKIDIPNRVRLCIEAGPSGTPTGEKRSLCGESSAGTSREIPETLTLIAS